MNGNYESVVYDTKKLERKTYAFFLLFFQIMTKLIYIIYEVNKELKGVSLDSNANSNHPINGCVVVCGEKSKQIKIREIEAFSVIKYCHQIHYKRPMGEEPGQYHHSLNIASLNLTAILCVA